MCRRVWEGKERGSFFSDLQGGKRMKASEDDPLTMKCDDPRSPSDTHIAQLNIALGSKPRSLCCEKESRVCA